MSNMPVGILLAAGQSQRFNSNKLLYPVIDDTPMLLVVAKKLSGVLPGSVVVISEALQTLTTQLEQLGLRVVINQQAERGMGSSIARGVRASQEATGWLVNLADMPYIKTETLTSLANRLTKGSDIVAPQYKQQRGHPVGFGRDYLNELLALDEDTGARNIVKNNRDKIEFVLTNDKGVIQDIDTPGDIYT